MGRPNKARRVCRMPSHRGFAPTDGPAQATIKLSVEEYEALRLMDYLGLNQQQAAAQMDISRSALQSTYAEARKKLAMFLVEGRQLQIEGGDYALCSRCDPSPAGQTGCALRETWKGVSTMKVAICYENGLVFQHFGHTQQFKLYDIADGAITHSEVVDTQGQGHGALAGVLQNLSLIHISTAAGSTVGWVIPSPTPSWSSAPTSPTGPSRWPCPRTWCSPSAPPSMTPSPPPTS